MIQGKLSINLRYYTVWLCVLLALVVSGIQSQAASPKLASPQSLPPLEEPITATHYEQKPISVTVSKTLYLPPDMYGQWSVRGEILESNAPEQFSSKLSDIWILEREGDQVIVSNPATGASATISVDKVEGDTATFHRINPEGRNQVLEEIPTITVRGDTLTGIMLNRVSKYKNGVLTPIAYVKYQLYAQRIGGGRIQFSPSEGTREHSPGAQPDIQIEPMKFIKGPKKSSLD